MTEITASSYVDFIKNIERKCNSTAFIDSEKSGVCKKIKPKTTPDVHSYIAELEKFEDERRIINHVNNKVLNLKREERVFKHIKGNIGKKKQNILIQFRQSNNYLVKSKTDISNKIRGTKMNYTEECKESKQNFNRNTKLKKENFSKYLQECKDLNVTSKLKLYKIEKEIYQVMCQIRNSKKLTTLAVNHMYNIIKSQETKNSLLIEKVIKLNRMFTRFRYKNASKADEIHDRFLQILKLTSNQQENIFEQENYSKINTEKEIKTLLKNYKHVENSMNKNELQFKDKIKYENRQYFDVTNKINKNMQLQIQENDNHEIALSNINYNTILDNVKSHVNRKNKFHKKILIPKNVQTKPHLPKICSCLTKNENVINNNGKRYKKMYCDLGWERNKKVAQCKNSKKLLLKSVYKSEKLLYDRLKQNSEMTKSLEKNYTSNLHEYNHIVHVQDNIRQKLLNC